MAQVVKPPRKSKDQEFAQDTPDHSSDEELSSPVAETPKKLKSRPSESTHQSPSPKRAKKSSSTSRPRSSQSQIVVEKDGSSTAPSATQEEEIKPRLVISHMVMNNFKSYYGRQVVGPFNDRFTAIIGPNGSGKSNVIDALLFVFGWQSKELRQKKNVDLIHKSQGYPVNGASVEIHFCETQDDHDGGSTRLPGTEFVVSRHIDKAGATHFKVNGEKRSTTFVTDKLSAHGIDLTHRRFLILQGEVENIAMMPPKGDEERPGLLEYLEDIIGTSKYVPQLKDLLRQLDELRADCLLDQTKVKASDESLKSLDESRALCYNAFHLQNEISIGTHTLTSRKVIEHQGEVNTSKEILVQKKEALKEVADSEKESDKQVLALEKRSKEVKKLNDKTETKLQQSRAELKKVNASITRAETVVEHSQSKQTKLEKEISSNQSSIDSTSTWLTNFDKDMADLANKITETKETLEADEIELANQRNKLAESIKPLTAKIEKKQAEVEPWRNKIQEEENQVRILESNLKESEDKVAAGEDKLASLKTRLADIGQTGKAQKKALPEIEAKLKQKHARCAELEEVVADSRPKLDGLQEKANQSRAAYMSAADSQSAAQSQGKIADALARFAAQENLQGYYGRLGNLGKIDQKYDAAVSTACPRLDQFVTSNMAVAEKCINYLRTNNIGRATFIALDKLKPYNKPNVRLSKDVPTLISLIEPAKPEFMKAFYFATGDTAVANDINEARQVAFGSSPRVKTVTLKGEVIAVSGAMSGGGNPVKGKMGSRFQNFDNGANLIALKKEMDDDDAELVAFKNEFQDNLASLDRHKAEVIRLEDELKELTYGLEETRAIVKELKASREELKVSHVAFAEAEAKRQDKYRASIKASKAAIEEFTAKSKALEEEIQSIREQILDKGGVELRILDAKVADQKNAIKQLSLQQRDKQSEHMSQSKKLERLEKDLVNFEKALEAVILEAEKAKEELASSREAEKGISEAVRELETQISGYENEIDEIKEQLSRIKEELSESARKKQSLEKAVHDLETSLNAQTKKLEDAKAGLEKLTLVDLEPYIDLKEKLRNPNASHDKPRFSELTDNELINLDHKFIQDLNAEVKSKQEQLDSMDFSVECMQEYRRVFAEWRARKESLDDHHRQFEKVKSDHGNITAVRRDQFLKGLEKIKKHLKIMYRLITTDGNADLDLYDTTDPFEGIVFEVMPPGKSWKKIQNLSGGEKTLSSLALVFALHKFKPTPLYVMDEIDAALDFRNVSIIANYIRDQTRQGQFIVISLRNNMFEMAGRLVGIYKYNDHTCSTVYDPPPPF